jgi:metal-responsive CopG/Arc/MetJ family transcriptional regulator
MKTAISIPDPLFDAAEKAAERLAISRSQFYAKAVEAFLAAQPGDDVTRRLNEVYAAEESRLDPALARMQALSIGEEGW